MNIRLIAIEILINVIENGHSLTESLSKHHDHDKISLIKQYCFGLCRWYFQADHFLKQLLKKKLNQKDVDIKILLLLGIYELVHMNTPDHAVVNECVKTTKQLKKIWAKNLVNAVLRNFIRKKESLDQDNLSHPEWLLSALKESWPVHWKAIIEANNQHPPMFLRVNTQKQTVADYLSLVNGHACSTATEAVLLSQPCPVSALPGFSEGQVSVQDLSAQLAAHFLNLQPGLRVLDACAAPGGKTCHIAEQEANLQTLIALDVDENRTRLIHDNLNRLGLSANVLCADAATPNSWWDGQLFDRILLDAPCSATGIIRRHPDIKLHRRKDDIKALAQTQITLLSALWPLLAPNGLLVYATCSILPQENTDVICHFLTQSQDANCLKINLEFGVPQKAGHQIFPEEKLGDGFYYAVLQKS